MTKENYDTYWYQGRKFAIIEIPYPKDCSFLQDLFAQKGINYDYRVNRDNGNNVLIVFKDNLTEEKQND